MLRCLLLRFSPPRSPHHQPKYHLMLLKVPTTPVPTSPPDPTQSTAVHGPHYHYHHPTTQQCCYGYSHYCCWRGSLNTPPTHTHTPPMLLHPPSTPLPTPAYSPTCPYKSAITSDCAAAVAAVVVTVAVVCCCPLAAPPTPNSNTLLTHQSASTNQSSNSHSSSLLEAQPHPCRLSPSCCFCCRCNKQEAREGI
jgi:hypothetical protein